MQWARRHITFGFVLVCIASTAIGQSARIHQSSVYEKMVENYIYTEAENTHTSVRPWLRSDVKPADWDSLSSRYKYAGDSKVLKEIMNEPFVQLNLNKFNMTLHPEFDLTGWANASGGSGAFEKMLGFNFNAALGKKLSGNFRMRFSNSRLPLFIVRKILVNNVVPGQGYASRIHTDEYQYSNGSGYISYTPSRFFNLQIGHGKNSIGDGYRSLLLSAHANNYGYARLTTNIWKIKYVNLFTSFKDIRGSRGDRSLFTQKYSSIHYLDWNISKSVSLGLFEAVVWQGEDTSGVRGFDVNYLNPIIFFRPVEFSLGSPDNVLLGINGKIKFLKRNFLYGQLLLDEFVLSEVTADIKHYLGKGDSTQSGWWANKQAFQVGIKGYEPFKFRGFFYQAEFNFVRPYTYTHITINQNYGHFNEPLAHPLGANLVEKLLRLTYQKGRIYAEAKLIHSMYGQDTSATSVSFGQNIFRSYLDRKGEYDNRILQGIKTTLVYGELNVAYILNAQMNLRLEAGVIMRRESNAFRTYHENYFKLGLKTSIPDYFYDY